MDAPDTPPEQVPSSNTTTCLRPDPGFVWLTGCAAAGADAPLSSGGDAVHDDPFRTPPFQQVASQQESSRVTENIEELGQAGWVESERDKFNKLQAELDKPRGKLDYAPFTDEEWVDKGYEVPKKDRVKRMARLGQGGFMTTYRMKNAAGECFAVKMVQTADMSFEGITREAVEREARTLERMKHKNVIRYDRLYEDAEEEVVGIVMEWAQGGSLTDLIKARKKRSQNVGMSELLDMSIQMAKALDYIHGEDILHILHRDVKADNVLLANAEGGPVCIKLADFGVAAVLTHTARTKSQTAIRGTERYYSPEKATSTAYGTKAEMWAVGCIIIELACCDFLTGALWSVGNLEVQDRRNKYFTQVRERLPGLADIAENLLDSDPTSRRSAPDLLRSLQTLNDDLEQDQPHPNKKQEVASAADFTLEQHDLPDQGGKVVSGSSKSEASVLSPPQQTLKNCHEQDQQTRNVAIGSASGAACSEGGHPSQEAVVDEWYALAPPPNEDAHSEDRLARLFENEMNRLFPINKKEMLVEDRPNDMLDAGSTITQRQGYAWPERSTPLLAVELYEQGKAMAVESLLKANADPNAQDPVSIHIHTEAERVEKEGRCLASMTVAPQVCNYLTYSFFLHIILYICASSDL
jgi:serine/threonine protein kinase